MRKMKKKNKQKNNVDSNEERKLTTDTAFTHPPEPPENVNMNEAKKEPDIPSPQISSTPRKKIKFKMNFVSFDFNKHLKPIMVNIFYIVVVFAIGFSAGYLAKTEQPIKIVKEENILKNKEGVIDWIYKRSQWKKDFLGMPKEQIEGLLPVLFEGPDPFLTIAVITYEGGWDATYTSPVEAIGLGGIWPSKENLPMLINAGIVKEDKRELYIPEVNIRATHFMISYMREWGNGDINKCFRYYRGLKRDKDGKACPVDKRDLNNYTNKILKAYWQLIYINNSGETNEQSK